jgi:hypothetical protein
MKVILRTLNSEADRAQLYFKGKWNDVGLNEIEQLTLYGVALVAEQLSVFADEKGIALLNTRGFLTEYAELLSKKSEKEGSIIKTCMCVCVKTWKIIIVKLQSSQEQVVV